MCINEGATVPRLSDVTDHIVPVELGGSMWDRANHQALCNAHHNGAKQALDNELRRLVEGGMSLRAAVEHVHPRLVEVALSNRKTTHSER